MDKSTKLGFIINKIDKSDKAILLIKLIEKLAKKNSIYLFYNDLPEIKVSNTDYFIMHAVQSFNFDGKLYSTCEYTTKQALNNFRASEKTHIINELEWVNKKDRFYADFCDCYLDKSLKLATISKDYREIIENVWQREVEVLDELF